MIAQRPTARDIELGTRGAVQIESSSDSTRAAIDAPHLTRAGEGSSRPSKAHLTRDNRLQERVMRPLRGESLARNILQPLSVGMQSPKEQRRSGFRLRHHRTSISEGVASSAIMDHEHRVRYHESCGDIGTSVEDVATWTWLKIKADEVNAQTAREQTEWEEVRQSRGGPTAASSSWPNSSEE